MKVRHNADYKARFTLEDLERSRRVIAWERENDDETASEWASYAINEALRDTPDYIYKVINATAETAKNYRAYDVYFDGSLDMDVWISATARTANGYIEIGAYLSDIWFTGAKHYKHHMVIDYFTREAL